MQFNWVVFGVGVLGGLVGEALKLWDLRQQLPPPPYLKSSFYWGLVVAMSLIGGLLAVIQNVDPSQLLLALNIGISAPLILKGLASVVPIPPPPAGTPRATPRPASSYGVIDMIAGRH